MLRHVVGVDVGGTKTRVCVLDERSRLVGSGLGGPGNPNFSSAADVREALFGAAEAARREAGLERGKLALGVVGGPCPAEHFEPALRAALGDDLPLFRAGEGPITLAAGSRDEHGIVLVAGTGSLAWGRNRRGETHVASGWGSLLGDEGSAYDIALGGLRSACRAADLRGPKTVLLDRYRERFGVTDLREIVRPIYGGWLDRRGIAATCPVVFDAARSGDAVARRILRRAARELALGAITCIRVLGLGHDSFDVVASGGVFRAEDFVFPGVAALIGRASSGSRLIRPHYEPAVGAALLALKALGVSVGEPEYARLDQSISAAGFPTETAVPGMPKDTTPHVRGGTSEGKL